MKERVMWAIRGKGRFLAAGAVYWGLVGGVTIFLIFIYQNQKLGTGEWIAVGAGAILAFLLGLLVSAMIWRLGVRHFSSSPAESEAVLPGSTEETMAFVRTPPKPSVSLQFDINLDPRIAQEAARVWFWRFVRRYRAWEMLAAIIFSLIVAVMAFQYQVTWVGILFSFATGLGLAYFPVFHFGFQWEVSRVARRLRKLNFTLTDDELVFAGGDRGSTIDLSKVEYILEQPKYFIVSYSRYGWVWLPHDDLPKAMLEILRSHPRYS